MARIVLATFGSLGDLHPKIALGLELKKRGHNVTIAAMEPYRERIDMLGLAFRPMAPDIDPNDTDLIPDLLHPFHGTERLIRDLIMPAVRQMYEDLIAAVAGADLVITGEAVYAASSVVEKTDISWISTSLAPISFFSPYDPPVPPQVPQFEKLRLFGHGFHRGVMRVAKWMVRDWYRPYGKFRRDLGLSEDHDPIFSGKFSPLLHLALFFPKCSAARSLIGRRIRCRPVFASTTATLIQGTCRTDYRNFLSLANHRSFLLWVLPR